MCEGERVVDVNEDREQEEDIRRMKIRKGGILKIGSRREDRGIEGVEKDKKGQKKVEEKER